MKINKDASTYKPPFLVILIDALDSYYYADVFEEDKMQSFDKFDDLRKAKIVADALFILKNYKWESLEAMNEVDGGWDVRVYDANLSCVYAAHQTFEQNWISAMPDNLK